MGASVRGGRPARHTDQLRLSGRLRPPERPFCVRSTAANVSFDTARGSLWQMTQYGLSRQPPGRRGAVVKVRDAMTGDVLTMTPGRSLRDAAKFMADHNVGAVVIMDPEQPGPGIFTERDLVRSIGKGESPDDEHVAEHLTSHAAFADIEWDLEEAADTMAK